MIIALAGPIGSGKSEVALYLETVHGFKREAFSQPLKDMLRSFGLTNEHLEGRLKNMPLACLGGKTTRHAMQTLGTEWGRGMIYPKVWTDHWTARAKRVLADGLSVVEEGTRFPNEIEAVKALGGYVLFVDRPADDRGVSSDHVSELGNLKSLCHATIINHGDIHDLYENIETVLQALVNQHG